MSQRFEVLHRPPQNTPVDPRLNMLATPHQLREEPSSKSTVSPQEVEYRSSIQRNSYSSPNLQGVQQQQRQFLQQQQQLHDLRPPKEPHEFVPIGSIKKSRLPHIPASDIKLMEYVLIYKPYAVKLNKRTALWKLIQNSVLADVPELSPVLFTLRACKHRVQRLLQECKENRIGMSAKLRNICTDILRAMAEVEKRNAAAKQERQEKQEKRMERREEKNKMKLHMVDDESESLADTEVDFADFDDGEDDEDDNREDRYGGDVDSPESLVTEFKQPQPYHRVLSTSAITGINIGAHQPRELPQQPAQAPQSRQLQPPIQLLQSGPQPTPQGGMQYLLPPRSSVPPSSHSDVRTQEQFERQQQEMQHPQQLSTHQQQQHDKEQQRQQQQQAQPQTRQRQDPSRQAAQHRAPSAITSETPQSIPTPYPASTPYPTSHTGQMLVPAYSNYPPPPPMPMSIPQNIPMAPAAMPVTLPMETSIAPHPELIQLQRETLELQRRQLNLMEEELKWKWEFLAVMREKNIGPGASMNAGGAGGEQPIMDQGIQGSPVARYNWGAERWRRPE